jgi:hypothetical protein
MRTIIIISVIIALTACGKSKSERRVELIKLKTEIRNYQSSIYSRNYMSPSERLEADYKLEKQIKEIDSTIKTLED